MSLRQLFRGGEPAPVGTSPALQPPPGNPRFPLMDSLRGIAILMVIAYHAAGTANVSTTHLFSAIARQGFVGVMLFFALSGFLIYRPFVVARASGRKAPSLRRYWRRRVLRIIPAYWVALTVLAIFGAVNDVFTERFWAYYGFLQIYSARTFSMGIPVAWSLCVEMSFYLVLPVYAWLVSRTGRHWLRAETTGISVLVLVSLGWRGAVHAGWLPDVLASAFPGMAMFFAIGMTFAAASVRLQSDERRSRIARAIRSHPDLIWLAGLGAFVAAATGFSLPTVSAVAHSWSGWYGNFLLTGVGATCLMAPAVFGQDAGGGSRRLMRTAALSWIGLLSYGIFLWHLPLLVKFHERGATSSFGLFATAFLAATAVAAVSYYVLELPFLRLKERRAAQPS